MKKICQLLFFFILTSCAPNEILKNVSRDPNFNNENFTEVFIIVNIWGIHSNNEYYQNLISKLNLEFKNKGINSSGFIYDKNMINSDEILQQKINIFNPKYIMEFQAGNKNFISIKELASGDEVWKAFLGKALISSDTFSKSIIQNLEKQKILK